MKFGKYFEYNGRSTEQYGLMLVSLDQDPDKNTGLSRSSIKGATTKFRKKANHLGMAYDEALSFEVTLIKDPHKYSYDQQKLRMKQSEVNELMRWLTSPNYPKLFRTYDPDKTIYDEEIEYFGVFTEIEFCTVGDVYGIKCVFECDSPYGYTPEYVRKHISTAGDQTTIMINNTSAEAEDFLYPMLEITANSDTDFIISNLTENKTVTYKGLKSGQCLRVDNAKCKITDLNDNEFIGLDVLGLDDVAQIYWFRLIDGFNKISFQGDVELKIKYRELRKVGEY